ncbi:MAG TPA: hypothetical protein VF520_15405 [Thermoleophilaceae bacterium]
MSDVRPQDRQVPGEADWERAPRLVEGAIDLELTPADCNLDYWLGAVAQGTLLGLVRGHAPESEPPAFMREPGPLRDALIDEFAFRSISEEKATRAISHLVMDAPDVETMEFFGTQLIDEARHARVFRDHIVELGVPREELFDTIEAVAGEDRDRILVPLEEFALPVARSGDFAGSVAILTILVEGVLAPLAELSERKWRPLDPAAADIERGANIDEVRHLTVGGSVVRRHLLEHPEDTDRLSELLVRGRALWAALPTPEVVFRRERLFQEGLELHADAVGDYEIEDGRRLLDTTPEQRVEMALGWSNDMQESRLAYMGLGDAVTSSA